MRFGLVVNEIFVDKNKQKSDTSTEHNGVEQALTSELVVKA